MTDFLTWLGQYSLPVAILIALGAALLYLVKSITEKAISNQFDRYAKSMDLQLQRRSNFEERVLLERYALLREIYGKLDRVFTNLRRRREGTEVEGLIRGNDVVPLTEVFEQIVANRHLIPKPFLAVLDKEAQLAIQYANADDEAVKAIEASVLALRLEFDQLMVDTFGLDRIAALD